MKKSLTTVATLLLVTALLGVHPSLGGGDPPQGEAASLWMKQKLGASQNVLAGLTKADFESIEKNAKSMIAVGYLEKWVRETHRATRRCLGTLSMPTNRSSSPPRSGIWIGRQLPTYS